MDGDELIGMTVFAPCFFHDENDAFLGRKFFQGMIIAASDETGIVLHNEETGEDRAIPPRLNALFPAPPGMYGDRDTGEFFENPDFVSQWYVRKVPGDNDRWEWNSVRPDLPDPEEPEE